MGRKLCLSISAVFLVYFWSSAVFAADGAHQISVIKLTLPGESLTYDRSFGRGLKQVNAAEDNSSLVLAQHRTTRHDPLNNFKKYRDGWDIRNKHYWASVGFTGLPGFVIALVWAAIGLLSVLLLCCCCCCCRSNSKYQHDKSKTIPLILLLLLSLAAVVGCVLVYYSQAKFHNELTNTLKFVVNQSGTTVENLQNVSRILQQGTTIDIFNFNIPNNEKQRVQQLSTQLNTTSEQLEEKTEDNARKIRDAIDIVRIAMIVVSAVMLLLVLLGIVFTACGLRSIVYLLVFLGWLLVIGTWILCGIFILLNNTMGDTCVAMEEWVRNPDASTNLDDILPCVNQTTANQTLDRSKEVTVSVVSIVNQAINLVLNNNNIPNNTQFNVNQSGPSMPVVCNPYGPAPDYVEQACSGGGVSLRDAPGAWLPFVCKFTSNGKCTSTGRMTGEIYNQLVKAVKVATGLYVNVPFLVNVENCVFVRDTFQEIISHRCPHLRKYTKYIWIGLALISSGAMLSIIFWIICARRRKSRQHSVSDEKPIYSHP